MDVKLVVHRNGQSAQMIRLRSAEMTIGRQKGCGVRIPSAQVSRQHCVLTYKDDLLSVEDLTSANGTYINGRRVVRREYLRPGDKLKVGPVTMLVQYQLTQAAIDRLLKEDEIEVVEEPLDDVEVLPEVNADNAEVELVLEAADDGPLAVDEPLDEPTVEGPMEALRAIEAKAADAPALPVKKKKPARPAESDDDVITITPEDAPSPPARVKLTDAAAPLAPAAGADPDDEADDEPAPDASQILGHKNWQLPTGEDIREILAQIEKGKKKQS